MRTEIVRLAFKCPGQDSNLHTLSGASPSSWYVYQFHHLGIVSGKVNVQNLEFKVVKVPSSGFRVAAPAAPASAIIAPADR